MEYSKSMQLAKLQTQTVF